MLPRSLVGGEHDGRREEMVKGAYLDASMKRTSTWSKCHRRRDEMVKGAAYYFGCEHEADRHLE
jgi:hypothetical protein